MVAPITDIEVVLNILNMGTLNSKNLYISPNGGLGPFAKNINETKPKIHK